MLPQGLLVHKPPNKDTSRHMGFHHTRAYFNSCTGANLGVVLALPISGFIASEFGWEYVFYLFGLLTLVWLIFWSLLASSSPAEHAGLSEVHCLICFCGGLVMVFDKAM